MEVQVIIERCTLPESLNLKPHHQMQLSVRPITTLFGGVFLNSVGDKSVYSKPQFQSVSWINMSKKILKVLRFRIFHFDWI